MVKNCDLVLENAALAYGLGQYFQHIFISVINSMQVMLWKIAIDRNFLEISRNLSHDKNERK